MPESLPVRLNHDRLHDIQTDASFEATDSFPILLENGDAPVHVHLHLDDALSNGASIPANNHFVDANSTRQVDVEVDPSARPLEGRLKIVTGHGAENDYVAIRIVEPADTEDAVDVDATLGKPAKRDDDEDEGFGLPDASLAENAPVAALGLFALAVAVSSATLSDSLAVLFGSLAVVGSVLAAVYLLVRQN